MSFLPKTLTVAALAAAASLYAGGFWLQMGNPEANPDAKSKNAVLVVQATGCHDPATAVVDGTAIRVVNGHKQTTPVKLVALKEPGSFGVIRDWPDNADVTLEFVGHNPANQITSLLVRARGAVIEKPSAKIFPRVPTEQEEMASLVR